MSNDHDEKKEKTVTIYIDGTAYEVPKKDDR